MANGKIDHIVVHPLWDEPEEKIDVENARPMNMSLGTRIALSSLQIYLAIIVALSVYRIFQLVVIFYR